MSKNSQCVTSSTFIALPYQGSLDWCIFFIKPPRQLPKSIFSSPSFSRHRRQASNELSEKNVKITQEKNVAADKIYDGNLITLTQCCWWRWWCMCGGPQKSWSGKFLVNFIQRVIEQQKMKKLKSFLSVLWAVKKNDEKSNSFETERLLWRLFIVEKLYLSENWVEENKRDLRHYLHIQHLF